MENKELYLISQELLDQSEKLTNTRPSDVTEYHVEQALRLRRSLGRFVSDLKYHINIETISIERTEAVEIADMKEKKVTDTVVRSAKGNIATEEKASRAIVEEISGDIWTEIKVLDHWIDIAKAELSFQRRLV